MYKSLKNPDGAVRDDLIQRVTDGALIPADPNNRDWAAYQAWLAKGNSPLQADK